MNPMSGMDHQVRVLWLTKGLGRGGAEQLLVLMADAHRQRGEIAAQCVRVLDAKTALVPALEAAGCTCRSLGANRTLDPRWVLRLVRLVRSARRDGIDIVHAHSPVVAGLARLALRTARRSRRAAMVTTEHNDWGTLHPLSKLLASSSARFDDGRISVSDQACESMSPTQRNATRVITHGTDLRRAAQASERRAATRSALGLADDDVAIMTVANYRTQKNYPNLLAAARRVIDQLPTARFIAIGQGPLQHAIETEHARLGLGERFTLLGQRDDVLDLLAAADVFTLASDYEGLPVALMEATAVGLPIVATAVGGVAEVIDETSGRLVPPRDEAALADALRAVAGDEALRTQLARGARVLAERFDHRTAELAVAEVYRAALAGR
jgi:glycosyltransferase involved in cell wall biosynthesis